MSDITMQRGDSQVFGTTVQDANGAAVNITGATLRFTAKDRKSDADAAAVISKVTPSGVVITNAAAGQAEVRLVPADTSGFTDDRVLYWDLQITDATGKVQTLDSGRLTVRADVTRIA